MVKETDINKVVRQHLEMEQFFAGFTIKCESKMTKEQSTEPRPLGNGKTMDNGRGTMDERQSTKKAEELEKIAEEVCRCRQCGLGSLRTNAVPGEGNPNTRIMFVGEAPGADEDAQGRPFVGRAGQLLDKVIDACGLKRSEVFIGNILKCRPPENRDPRPEEIISCLPYLQRQIEIIDPEIIVALGAHAARTLLNTNKAIGQLRGQFHEYCAGLGRPPIKVMVTYHTAALLRNPHWKRGCWEDVQKFRKLYDSLV